MNYGAKKYYRVKKVFYYYGFNRNNFFNKYLNNFISFPTKFLCRRPQYCASVPFQLNGIASISVSSRGLSKPSPAYLPVANTISDSEAGALLSISNCSFFGFAFLYLFLITIALRGLQKNKSLDIINVFYIIEKK